MKLSEESKKKIIDAYIGDLYWLETIQAEMQKYKENELYKSDLAYDHEEFEKAEKMVVALFRMNFVVLETETEEYAEKYYTQAHELYAEMKVDLTEMLGIEDMWEEI